MKRAVRLGCCNMALWDFLIVGLVAGFGVRHFYELHDFYALLVGIGAGVAVLLLMRVPLLGALLQIACGLFWSQAIWRVGYHFHPTQDPTWFYGMQILLAIVCVLLHFVSVNALLGSKKKYRYQEMSPQVVETRYGAIDLEEDTDELRPRFLEWKEAYLDACEEREEVMDQAQELLEEEGTDDLFRLMKENDRIWRDGSAKMEIYVDMLLDAGEYREQRIAMVKAEKLLQQMTRITWEVTRESNRVLKGLQRRYLEDAEREEFESEEQEYFRSKENKPTVKVGAEVDESLFAGCRDAEALTRRYRSLMKAFHPDTGSGDTDMTIKVQKTYEHLMKKYKN